jgi:hypothetical protein
MEGYPRVSISLYYTARRDHPLSSDESGAIERLRHSYSIRDQVERRAQTGKGHNGENFGVYDRANPGEPDIIFEGATKLPGSQKACWELLQHWCELLSEVRRAVPGAQWHVHVDDHDIRWDEEAQAYDPSA